MRYFLALQTDNWTLALELINRGVAPCAEDSRGHNAMYWAIYSAPIETLERLVKLGVPFQTTGSSGQVPILLAASRKRWDVVGWLLNQYDLSKDLYVGQQLFLIAVNYGNIDLTEKILRDDISPNFYSNNGLTPLHVALKSDCCRDDDSIFYSMISLLVENGADIYAPSKPTLFTGDSHVGFRSPPTRNTPAGQAPLDIIKDSNDKALLRIIEAKMRTCDGPINDCE